MGRRTNANFEMYEIRREKGGEEGVTEEEA